MIDNLRSGTNNLSMMREMHAMLPPGDAKDDSEKCLREQIAESDALRDALLNRGSLTADETSSMLSYMHMRKTVLEDLD